MQILTFDIEEWFHILDNPETQSEKQWVNFECRIFENMDRIHAVLEKNNQKATFFCIGWVAQKYPEIIKRIDAMGYEIGTHSHLHQLAYNQSKVKFEEDLKTSVSHLENITGKKINAYRAPGFSIIPENKWAIELLIKNGIEIDASIFPAKRAHGGFEQFGAAEPCIIDLDGLRIKEFPINLKPILGRNLIFSGGGYFRLLPEWLLNSFFNDAEYVMTYFHPRDFDAKQPMVPGLNAIRKFKSYYGLESCMPKLENLIKSQQFIDIKTADAQINWVNAKVIKI